MPHPAAYGLVCTVRDDGSTQTKIDTVPAGVRIDVTDSDGNDAGQLIAR